MTEPTTMDRLADIGLTRRHLFRLLGAGAAVAATSASTAQYVFGLQESDTSDRPELIIGVQGLPASIDPPQSAANVSDRVLGSIFDLLIANDFAGGDQPGMGSELVPAIAESWERVDDRTVALTIRADVLFHDGSTLTAEDVKFTFDRLMADDAPEEFAYALSSINMIESVEIVDDSTIHIRTIEPDVVLERRLANWPLMIVPKAVIEEVGNEAFSQAPIGTGPYRVAEFVTDDRLVLESFDDYFGGLPPVSRVTFRMIPEMATRMTSVISNEAQIVTNVPPDQVATFENDESVTIHQVPLANYHMLIYQTHDEVMSNKLLRQAMSLGIDRDLLIQTLWSGAAIPTRGPQIEAWGEYYNDSRPFNEYDPERAQDLIAESGYNGEEILFRAHPTYYTNGLEAAQAIVQMWQQIGLNVVLEPREQLWEEPEKLQVCHWSNGLYPFDPDTTFFSTWGPGFRPQLEWWTPENERFNELGLEARQMSDPQERYDAYQELIDIWLDEAPATVLYIPTENYVVRNNVEWTPYATYFMDFRSGNVKVSE